MEQHEQQHSLLLCHRHHGLAEGLEKQWLRLPLGLQSWAKGHIWHLSWQCCSTLSIANILNAVWISSTSWNTWPSAWCSLPVLDHVLFVSRSFLRVKGIEARVVQPALWVSFHCLYILCFEHTGGLAKIWCSVTLYALDKSELNVWRWETSKRTGRGFGLNYLVSWV